MHKRYQAKHYNGNLKFNVTSKLSTAIVSLVLIVVYVMGGILSYFTDTASATNSFTIAEKYTVIFDANGGTGSMANQEIYCGHEAALNLNSYTYTDYVFDGWNTAANGSGTSYADGQHVTDLAAANSSIRLYAQWVPDRYVAEIDGVRYTTLASAINAVTANGPQKTIKLLKNIEVSAKLTIPANKNIILNLQNHTIKNASGYNSNILENSGTIEITNGTIQSSGTSGAINNTATGHMIINGLTVSATGTRQALYNLGGHMEITGNSVLSSTTTERATVHNAKPNSGPGGTLIISSANIVSTAATTKGAVENDETCTMIITGGTIVSNNGIGVDNFGSLTIGEDDEEVDISSPVIQGATIGVNTTDAATLVFNDGIVKGQTSAFNDENYVDSTAGNASILHGTEQINGDTYNTAYLDAQIKIIFDPNGGTCSVHHRYYDYGDPLGTLPTATKPSCSLDGWFTEPSGGQQVTSATNVTESTTYYAHWTVTEALIIFDGNGGTPSEAARSVEFGNQIGTLPTATQTYKTFVGWFTDPDNGTQITDSTVINADATFYAHWSSIPVRINFDANLGTVTEAYRDLNAGDVIGQLPLPTRANFAFAGWYTDPVDGTRVKENEIVETDMDLYAHWVANPVAYIGTVHYEKLLDAIRDVEDNNVKTTITLESNTLEAVDIVSGQNILLNLNGYTLYNDGSKVSENATAGRRPSTIENYGELEIINGTVNSSSTQSTINNNGGGLTLHDVTVTQTGNSNKQAIYNDGGTLLISGNSNISAKNSGSFGGAYRGAIQNLAGGTAIITGGTITSSTSIAIVNQANSLLQLGTENGSIDNTTPTAQGRTYGVYNYNNGTFEFYDGTVKGITNSINGAVTEAEPAGTRVDTTEIIDSYTYHITYYQ